MDTHPRIRELEQAASVWINMKSRADNTASLERKKYGHSTTTSASYVENYPPLLDEEGTQQKRKSASLPEYRPITARHGPVSGTRSRAAEKEWSTSPSYTSPAPEASSTDETDNDDDVKVDLDLDEQVSYDDRQRLQSTGTQTKYQRMVSTVRSSISSYVKNNWARIRTTLLIALFLLYSAYFGWVLSYNPKNGEVLIVITCLSMFMIIYSFLRDNYGNIIYQKVLGPVGTWFGKYWKYLRWVLVAAVLTVFILFLALEVAKNPVQLRSLAGMVLILTFVYMASVDQTKVRWRPVIWGITLQVIMGLLVLRWQPGYDAFFWVSSKVQTLLNYADYGAKFMFGDPAYLMHPMAFKVIPMVVFFSAFTNMMFYLGVMQAIIRKVSWLMQRTMHTTTIETLSVAGNIFFTLAEESFILRPYIMKLTRSELHAVMTGGSATAAGFALAMYIELGAPAIHVFSAAVMSAPAALAIAKLSYPELEESQTRTEADVHIESGDDQNILEAAASGATMSIKVISYAVAILIAFFGLLALLNDLLAWVGDMVGYPQLSFELICSYVIFPVTYMAGIEAEDAGKVASMLGIKYFGSDLIAYTKMGKLRALGQLKDRSAMIGTYSLLGFSSLSSIGVNIGILGAMAPERRNDIASLAIRAIVNGNLASLLTACLAGFLNPA